MCGIAGCDSEQVVVLRLVFQEKKNLLKSSFNVDRCQIVYSLTSERLDILRDLRRFSTHISIVIDLFSKYLLNNY